jgi:hypothetical protein
MRILLLEIFQGLHRLRAVAACFGSCCAENVQSIRSIMQAADFTKTGVVLLYVFLHCGCFSKLYHMRHFGVGMNYAKKGRRFSCAILNAGHDLCKIEVVQQIDQEIHVFLKR